MPTASERQRIAEHLAYELKMLWAAGGAMLSRAAPNTVLQNCAVESFALHARNVIDFFYTEPKQDDVVAEHFFSDPSRWMALRPGITPTLDAARKRANKEVSHLTYSRLLVPTEQKGWPVRDIVGDLDSALSVFTEKADLLPADVAILRYRHLLP
jgi:hypothetical protein